MFFFQVTFQCFSGRRGDWRRQGWSGLGRRGGQDGGDRREGWRREGGVGRRGEEAGGGGLEQTG